VAQPTHSGFVHPLERATRVPRTCIWEITEACNLSCVHCDNHAARRSPRELSLKQLFGVADGLARLGCRTVDVTGGEPLLRPEWAELCAHLTGLGLDVALITNGLLLDAEAVGRAVRAGVKTVAVSLDGLRSTHDDTRRRRGPGGSVFDETIAAIGRARSELPAAVITQVNRHNLPELEAVSRLLAELGVVRWQLQLTIPTPRVATLAEPYAIAPEQLRELVDFIVSARQDSNLPEIHVSDTIGYCTELEPVLRSKSTGPGLWLGCIAGIRSVAIKSDGTVRGCSLMPPDFDAGNLHDESIETIWNDAPRFGYTTRFHPRMLAGECAGCSLGPLCRAGCNTLAYYATGTLGDNPYCLRRWQGFGS
jgi:radical SAM protein with 4Fe4S-binding SPASM domain